MTSGELSRVCAFETERLDVANWHSSAARAGIDLPVAVATILTASTTGALPAEWSGDYDLDRAHRWIAERDAESATLLAVERSSGAATGLTVLFESPAEVGAGLDLRLGYVIAERAWGRGLATELVGGLVRWAGERSRFRSMSGGVTTGNAASARVLAANGFRAVGEPHPGEQLFVLTLDR